MSNTPYRTFDVEKDMKAVQRIWQECGWIDDDDDDDKKAMEDFFKVGHTEVATINDEAECSVIWTEGSFLHQETPLKMGAVTGVTTSHIARKLGFAKVLTARSLANQAAAGMEISALGMFDQGFYDKVGYGTGPYETMVRFNPSNLTVDAPFRVPTRLTTDHWREMHEAMHQRRMAHGSATLAPPEVTKAELIWTEKPFGLGYFDGPGGSLSHFIWGERKDEHGPYRITVRSYQNTEQLMELLALLKSLGDQVHSVRTLEFGEFQLQDLIRLPFKHMRMTHGSTHQYEQEAFAYWQLRILDLAACMEKTSLPGPDVSFNLALTDPVKEILAGETEWQGIGGDYVVTLGGRSHAAPGREQSLPTLNASVNAFSRMWIGVRPASQLAITDDLHGDAKLLARLDKTLRLPRPHLGWDF